MQGTFHIGANVVVQRENKILLGLRRGYGDGMWGMPGGHVDPMEMLEEAARRELLEETGIVATQFEFLNAVNQPNKNDENKHYVQFVFRALDPVGEPQLMEPDECSEWRWFDIAELPENVFIPHRKHLELFAFGGHFAEETDIV